MENDREPTLRELLDLLRRGTVPALLAAVSAAVLTYFVNDASPRVYQAQATVMTANLDASQRDFGAPLVTAPALAVATYRAAISSRPVVADALTTINGTPPGLRDVEDLQAVTTVRSEDSNISAFLRITVKDRDPAHARDLANALADAAVRWDVQRATRSLEAIVASLEARIVAVDTELISAQGPEVPGLERVRADLGLQLSSARALRSAAVGRMSLFETAEVPQEAVSPRPLRNAALAAVLATFLVFGLLAIRNALDTRIRDLDALAALTGLAVLAAFPKQREGRLHLPAEAASYLRTAVSFATADVHPKVILVTSAGSGQGKSSVAIAMATSFARHHYRTLLVDADLRDPVLGREFGLDPYATPSLVDHLEARETGGPTRMLIGREVSLSVLPSFRAAENATELLSMNIRRVLDHLAKDFDVIVIDSAPVLPVADALTIAPHVTGVVFTVSVGTADRKNITEAIALLRSLGATIFGTVGTNMTEREHGLSGTGYGYGGASPARLQPTRSSNSGTAGD